ARAIRLVLSLEEAAQVTAYADRIGGAQDYPQDARDKIYNSLQVQTRQDTATRTYPVIGAPLSDFAVQAKREIDDAVALLQATNSLSIVGNGNAAKRYGDKFVIGGFEGPLKGGKVAVVVLDHDENVHEGELYYHHEEVLPLYSAILTERKDAQVAIHTHSPHLVSWALAQRALPVGDFPELAVFGLDAIPITAAAARYDAEPVVDTLRAFSNAPALLHANHGLLAWGTDFPSLARLVVALEEAARLQIEAASLSAAA
ncbi:MAG: class II aldolase/adducin family protein, partial [Asticcacaulis sp.]|nr:class II aldolase/adducin family protein [Asticcacaulis sp.]